MASDPRNLNEEIVQVKTSADVTILQKLMECPICYDICIPPVFVCKIGHHICENCFQRIQVKKCCICSAPFLQGRNFFYEDLFFSSTFTCRFASEGCQMSILGSDLKSHLDSCDFRPIRCCIRGCRKTFKYSQFSKHLTDSHLPFLSTNDGHIVMKLSFRADTRVQWEFSSIQFQGYTFFPNFEYHNQSYGIFLRILGNEEDAKKFRVMISLGNDSSAKAQGRSPSPSRASPSSSLENWLWSGPVFPIRASFKTLFGNGHCWKGSTVFLKATVFQNSSLFDWLEQNIGEHRVEFRITTIDNDLYNVDSF